MAPLTSAERQKLLLQQEIAKLSGAISRHSTQPSYHPYRGRGAYRGTRGRGRGRGRGGSSTSLDLRGQTGSSSPAPAAPAAPVADSGTSTPDWVKGTSKSGNMSIMTAERSAQLNSRPPRPPKTKNRQVTVSSEGGKVVIDGVVFQFEQDGKKLTRIGELPSNSPGTPRRLNVGGQKYRRTSRGNLVQSKSKLASTPCRYYTKTGRCNRALTCPYAHIPDRLAICPRFLRGTCPNTASSCPLSHKPSAHNTPSCIHFQSTSTCRNGSECVYPHVRVADDAPVCEAFAREGWCDKEAGTCPNLHVWECGEWREKGTCSRGQKCGLRHVLRAEKGKEVEFSTPVIPPEGGFEDNADYVNLDLDQDDESEASDEDDEDDESSSGESDESMQSGESEDESEAEAALGVVS